MHNPPCFLIFFLLFASTFCHGSDLTTVEVVGVGECADCYKNNIKTNHAFSGLSVSIDCKQKDGTTERKGVAKLDEEGNFKVLLPTEVLNKDGNLKGKCFAQLHSASSTPCPSHDGSEMASMIAIKSKDKGKQTFGLPNGIKFKSETCVSAFFWHHYFHHPPLPPFSIPVFPPHPPVYTHPLFPPKVYVPPTTPVYEKPPPVEEKPPPVEEKPPPVYVEPLPPPVPVYKPKPPVYKPKPPVYKPKPPVYKPKPPVYKPKPPVYKPKPPVYKPPTPQKPESPPYYKHPWYKILPPISKLPPCPPTPKVVVPPKYYSHPKIGKKFPPLSPSVPHLN